MVTVAQLVEPRTVTPVVVGSSPIGHPNFLSHGGKIPGLPIVPQFLAGFMRP